MYLLSIEKVKKNVYAITDGSTRGNVTAYVLPTQIVFIDSGMNLPLIKKFREYVEQEANKKASVLFITHEHGDHYDQAVINMLQKEDTMNVFPAYMSSEIALHDGMAVVPGDTFQVGTIEVTCFYMYTFAPEGYDSSHPAENNYTSYLIDIGGFTFFHAGDSSNIPEYSQLTGLVDVALLPLGPGCQTMTGIDVVVALDVISPSYFIPIHFAFGMDVTFVEDQGTAIANIGCELLHMSYYSDYTFRS